MKRSPMPPRTTRLRSTGRLKAVGATKLKKQKRYKAYLRSVAWKAIRAAAIARTGGMCEATYWSPVLCITLICGATTHLTVHHLTYARFGGDELPEDLQVLCRGCHNRVHALEGRRIA